MKNFRAVAQMRSGNVALMGLGEDLEDAEYYAVYALSEMDRNERKNINDIWYERYHGTPERGKWKTIDLVVSVGRLKLKASAYRFHESYHMVH